MSDTWYTASSYRSPEQIVPVEVVKETDRTITIQLDGGTRRRDKRGQHENFFPSKAEAIKYLLQIAEDKKFKAQANLTEASKRIKHCKALLRKEEE